MNARDLKNDILPVDGSTDDTSMLPDVWKHDFTCVPPAARRAARYVLQLLGLERKFMDEDNLDQVDMAWKIVFPLIDQAAESRAIDSLPHTEEHLQKRVNKWHQRVLLELPSGLLDRLKQADGDAPTQVCVQLLADTMKLNTAETRILDYLELDFSNTRFTEFLRVFDSTTVVRNRQRLAAMLDVGEADVRMALQQKAPLREVQLVELHHRHRCDLEDYLDASTGLGDIFFAAPATARELSDLLMESSPPSEWAIDDFPHMETDAARLTKVLPNAARQGTAGVNALLFGPPGTGKTEFARALAHAAGLTLYQVRNADEDGDGMGRDGRLTAYMLAQHLLRSRKDAVILFDEVEDVFADDDGAMLRMLFGADQSGGKEKGYMNRLLETNPVPAIWVTNNVRVMDAAFLRRFLLPVEFSIPPRNVRRKMVERHLGDCNLSGELLDQLAADGKLAPAQFGDARRLLGLHEGQGDTAENERIVRDGVGSIRRLLHGSRSPIQRRSVTTFDVGFLNIAGGVAPQRIAAALDRTGRGSLCFYGPPGTGKTEFAHVLADALGRELVVRQSSDLVSKYVGETEQNIARLFNTIDAERSILFIDEVDSFLRSRREAQHSWEITAVNELLQHMENFPGIFIAATNLMTGIDPAALRRFDFKLAFQPMALPQRMAMFAREALGDIEAGTSLPAPIVNRLSQLESLTPGDFANVCRQREILAEDLAPEEFLRRLVQECRWKAAA